MIKKINKIITLVIAIILSNNLLIFAYAGNNRVYAEKLNVKENNLLVPVKITSQEKLMGFKISVSYPVDSVQVTGITRGSVTAKGNFSTNFGVMEGSFDILWNNSSEVEANGTLFVLTVDTSQSKKNTEIKLSYSQPDTFNENYSDVVLNCDNILIGDFVEGETVVEITEVETTHKNNNDGKINIPVVDFDGAQVVDAANNVLQKNDIDSIYEVEDKNEFLNGVNDNLKIILNTDQIVFSEYGDLIKTYEDFFCDDFVSEIILNNDVNDIEDVFEKTFKKMGVESFDKIDRKKINEFNKIFENNIKKLQPETKGITKFVSENVAFNTIKKIYKTTINTKNAISGNTDPLQTNERSVNSTNIILLVIIVFVVCGIVCIFGVCRRKNKRK